MMEKALEIMKTAFTACTAWFTQLVSATGSQGIILAAFSIVLIIGLLFIPMRGGSLVTNFDTFADFNANVIHKKGKYGGKVKTLSRSSKGKFSSGNGNSARIVRRSKHRDL